MGDRLDEQGLNQLFTTARTFNGFKPDPVPDDIIRQVYDLVKWGPTAFNSQPSRYLFLKSDEAKAKLAPALSSSNREKTLNAPLNIILAYDTAFYEHLPALTASPNARELFENNPGLIEPTLLRNGSLQGGYLVLALRALGLDVGVITGFKPELVNEAFFPDGRFKVNVIINTGYGDPVSVKPRAHRFAFADVAEIL